MQYIEKVQGQFCLHPFSLVCAYHAAYPGRQCTGMTVTWITRKWADAASGEFLLVCGSGNVDYPPLYLYILHFIGRALRALDLLPVQSLGSAVKMSWCWQISFRILCTGRQGREKTALVLSGLYLFNPAILVNPPCGGNRQHTDPLGAGPHCLYHDSIMASAFSLPVPAFEAPGFYLSSGAVLELVRKRA